MKHTNRPMRFEDLKKFMVDNFGRHGAVVADYHRYAFTQIDKAVVTFIERDTGIMPSKQESITIAQAVMDYAVYTIVKLEEEQGFAVGTDVLENGIDSLKNAMEYIEQKNNIKANGENNGTH